MQKSQFAVAAEEALKAIGGKENLVDSFHCATRLRVYVSDKTKVDTKALKATKLMKGFNWEGDQLQMIFGPGTVNKVYDNFNKSAGVKPSASDSKPKRNDV